MKNVIIIAKKSVHHKCQRCWNSRPDCEYNTYFEDYLCYRCVQVLCELEEKGLWLKCPACLNWFYDREGSPDNLNDNYICPDCLQEIMKKENEE